MKVLMWANVIDIVFVLQREFVSSAQFLENYEKCTVCDVTFASVKV